MKFILSLLVTVSAVSAAHAHSFRSNLHLSYQNDEVSVRTNSAAMLGWSGFSFGAYGIYETPHTYLTDTSFGLAARIGEEMFFELGGGLFERKFEKLTGKGSAGYMMFGWVFDSGFNISGSVTVKRITEGLDPRWIYDVYPTIGWTFGS